MIFLQQRVNCVLESLSRPTGIRFQAHFNRISIKSTRKPTKFATILLIQSSKYQQEHCVSVSAGRFSVVSGSGSWSDPRVLAWGSVRLFLCSDVKFLILTQLFNLPSPHSKNALNMFFGSITPYNPNINQEKQNGNTN